MTHHGRMPAVRQSADSAADATYTHCCSKSGPVAMSRTPTRTEYVYAGSLFVLAVTAVGVAARGSGDIAALTDHAPTALFFFLFGLLTIAIGYQHPRFGYYSFDRISQVASILVLGPVGAALINGLASFVYPWHRRWRGVPTREVVFASLNNAGLMTLIILLSGHAYTLLGGRVPLAEIRPQTVGALLALLLSMQALNDLLMLGLLRVGGHSLSGFFQWFPYAWELGSGVTAILVALIYSLMDTRVFALLLVVLTIGMLALRQFADMRYKLERIVDARTESLRRKARELELQATQDNLTGLFNRRYADDYLESRLAEPRPQLAIALADIDLFKQINDLHSHGTGDEVLRRIAAILRECCRPIDTIARYGGEEFLICFPDTELRQARAICERLRLAVEKEDWTVLGLNRGVTISCGIAENRRGALSRQVLVARADAQLYEAKHNGRNLVVA